MERLSGKQIRQLKESLEKIQIGLQSVVSAEKFEDYSGIALFIARVLDSVQDRQDLTVRIQALRDKGIVDVKKKYYLKKMLGLLEPKVELLLDEIEQNDPMLKNDLIHCYEDRGFRNSSIERLEALKLQLELATQKGFYSLSKDKLKVKAQEDILLISAQIIQELSYETDLVAQVMQNFQKVKEFENIPFVTETEEAAIANCYILLFESLLNLNYR